MLLRPLVKYDAVAAAPRSGLWLLPLPLLPLFLRLLLLTLYMPSGMLLTWSQRLLPQPLPPGQLPIVTYGRPAGNEHASAPLGYLLKARFVGCRPRPECARASTITNTRRRRPQAEAL